MSLASRQPYFSPVPASWPKMVDSETGRIDRAAIRKELSNRSFGPAAWPFSRVLAQAFQKVRLQHRWIQHDIEEGRLIRTRIAQERTALDISARKVAEACNFDTAHLRYQRERYAFGSLADTWRAPQMRQLYDRALEIAIAYYDAPALQAAE